MPLSKCFTPTMVVLLMTYTNVLNYVDRMIISGAPNEFETFVTDSAHVSVDKQSVYLGFLMTAFIIAYSVANIIFGHMVNFHRPFHIVSLGLFIWCVAIFLSGFAKTVDSFWLLLGARALSGVGEAGMQTVVPAFIDEHVKPSRKSVMLAVFYLGFPVGGALGFLWGSLVASSIGWQYAFWLELPAIIPVIFVCVCLPYRAGSVANQVSPTTPAVKAKSLHFEVYDILLSHDYKLVTVGSAAMLAIITSFATFGPTFMMGLGFFDNESSASFAFGAITCASGLFGTLLGGYINDVQKSRFLAQYEGFAAPSQVSIRAHSAKMCTQQMTITATIAFGCFLVAIYASNTILFMIFMFLGELALFMPTALQVEVLMLFVKQSQRGLAVGLYNFLGHALGDVPSPIIVGALKDMWAPKCNSVKACCASDTCVPKKCCKYGSNSTDSCPSSNSLRSVLGPDCHEDRDGMRLTLLVAVLWLIICILCWLLVHLRMRRSPDLLSKNKAPPGPTVQEEGLTGLSRPLVTSVQERSE